ncbi:MAG: valine--tRNA ligase [Candidatus Helarchaeota archaeon]
MAKFMLPKRYNFKEIEKKWIQYWKENNIYSFNTNTIDKEIYSIDTPPPFTSGTLHMGHILNHTWIDLAARFKRMSGYNVYFPQGYDCHGLPTELKVEKEFGISKDNRKKFLEKCIEWTNEAILTMTRQFDNIGYSTDWNFTYKTMNQDYLHRVQKSLLYFFEKGWLFLADHPIHWCVKCRTALAKQEVGYIDKKGKLWYIKLPLTDDSGYATIATTRPELMPSCVAVLIHPDDQRYYQLSQKKVRLPIFDREVPIYQDSEVDMEFGTGIVYVCTFGDETDIAWQKSYALPVIISIDEKGRMTENAGKFQGMSIDQAREAIVKELDKMGLMEKVEDFDHRVVVHTERSSCLTPIEFLPIKQWFISIRPFKEEILKAAHTMNWYPPTMIKRLEDWIESLEWDWVISRQRVFGTPIPFYSCEACNHIIPAKEENLPTDPRHDPPPLEKCPKCGGKIIGTTDVCDCWIDSSITPLAISKWSEDEIFFNKTYPSTLRPQGYEIIRTWAFYTIFRCLKLTGNPCFRDLMINGMVAGTDGRKMSKSYGNVVAPEEPLEKYGADALRQWAALGSLGDDYPFNYKEITYSLRFLTKLWNACRFSSAHLKEFNISQIVPSQIVFSPVDEWILSKLNQVIETVTNSFKNYNFHTGLSEFRQFFWHDFCDNYLEAIKYKLYSEKPDAVQKLAGQYTIYSVIFNSLKLFAPVAPFITEEIFSSLFKKDSSLPSIHLSEWPTPIGGLNSSAAQLGARIIKIISEFRRQKSELGIPLNSPISKAIIKYSDKLEGFDHIQNDVAGTLKIDEIILSSAPPTQTLANKFKIAEEHLEIYWEPQPK